MKWRNGVHNSNLKKIPFTTVWCMVSPPAGCLEDDLAIVCHRDTIIVGQCQNLVVVQHSVQIPQIMRQSDKIYIKGSFCCDVCRESQSPKLQLQDH